MANIGAFLKQVEKEADESVKKIINNHASNHEVKVLELYKGNQDYKELVNLVFEYDKVICW